VSSQAAGGTEIRFDQAPASASDASAVRVGAGSLFRGAAIGLVLVAIAAVLGLLFTLFAFGYSFGELL
jgi:hypothetical protein